MRLTALVIIILSVTGIATSQTKYPKTVIIDTTFLVSDYFGDTVTMYSPGQIVKIGKRMMAAAALEQELGAYKVLYAHCDSLRMIHDSTAIYYDEVLNHMRNINLSLSSQLALETENNQTLTEIVGIERKKTKRQKYVYGFSGGGIGLLSGIIFTLIVIK